MLAKDDKLKDSIDEAIPFDTIKLLDDDKRPLEELITKSEALKAAKEKGLALIMVGIAKDRSYAICIIYDEGKFRYEQIKKNKKRSKNSVGTKLSTLRTRIDSNDLNTKIRLYQRHLKDGHNIKVNVKIGKKFEESKFIVLKETLEEQLKPFYSKATSTRQPRSFVLDFFSKGKKLSS